MVAHPIRLLVILGVLFAAGWALRFVPQLGMPDGLSAFCGGVASGLLIAAIATWSGRSRAA
jgi:hypothetical protein